jgi:hypothetical protein
MRGALPNLGMQAKRVVCVEVRGARRAPQRRRRLPRYDQSFFVAAIRRAHFLEQQAPVLLPQRTAQLDPWLGMDG